MESCISVAQRAQGSSCGALRMIEKDSRCKAMRTLVMSYTVQGFTVLKPAASNGSVSRVATIMPLAAAVAAM